MRRGGRNECVCVFKCYEGEGLMSVYVFKCAMGRGGVMNVCVCLSVMRGRG